MGSTSFFQLLLVILNMMAYYVWCKELLDITHKTIEITHCPQQEAIKYCLSMAL